MPITKLTPENQPSLSDDRLAALRALLPEAVADGKLNWETLREMLAGQLEDEASEAAGKPHDEHFGLFWPGKRAARREAASPAKAGLHPAPGEGVDEANTRNLYLEGDNLSVLKLLRKAYSGRVKMIYIDPPYNTGNDFVYKDNFAESSDTYLRRSGQADASGQRLVSNPKAGGRFHSNWLNMIYPRLLLARELLRDDGVIFVSIDDNEVHHLRMVMDEIFGAENFAANLIWQGSKKGDTKLISTCHEYVIIFAKNKDVQIDNGKWRIKKEGADEVIQKHLELQKTYGNDHNRIEEEIRNWFKSLPKDDPRYAHKHYRWSDNRGLYFAADFAGPDDGRLSRPRYDIFHPITKKSCKKPSTGWRWDEIKTKQALNENPPRIHFGEDENTIPCRKSYLFEIDTEPFNSVFYRDGRGATLAVERLLGKGIFEFPKDVQILKTFLTLTEDQEGIFMDFFSGSGSTAQAVFEKNQEDGGSRRFILVQLPEATNNPQYPTIAEIGKERIRRVITQLRSSAVPPAAAPPAAVAAQTSLALTPAESADPQPTTAPTGDVSTTDLGFKVFKLAPSVFRDWQDYAGSDPNALHDLFSQAETPLRAGWQAAEVLAEVMLLEGFPLDSLCRPAAAFTHNTVFCVQSEVCQHRLFVCLEAQLHPATLQQLAELRRDVFICLDSALSDQAKVRLQDVVNLKVI